MMWGWRRARMYSNSRRTRILVFSRKMTALEMYFIATRWPVTVWIATGADEDRKEDIESATYS